MVKEAQEELAYKAIMWCHAHDKVTSPQNIVMALDNLGLLSESRLTLHAPDGSKALPIVANPSEVTSPFTDDNQ